MRNYLSLIVVLLLFSTSCKKDEEELPPSQSDPLKIQWGFVLNYTATW